MTENDVTANRASRRSRTRLILGATAAAAIVAAVVIFVLPAETGIDPTGLGEAGGLTEMVNPGAGEFLERGLKRKGVFTPTSGVPQAEAGPSDHWEHELAPFEEIELKYDLAQGTPIAFAWSATGPLNYDMHAHPFEGGEALTESYAIAKTDRLAGRYVAAFSGIHGWHWQNRTTDTVRITLDASGKIDGSRLFDRGGERKRELTPAP